MYYSRRQFLTVASTASAFLTTSCATSYGHKSSYISQVLKPQNRNTVFHWVDISLQQVRDQRVSPPRAATTITPDSEVLWNGSRLPCSERDYPGL